MTPSPASGFMERAQPTWQRKILKYLLLPTSAGTLLVATALARPVFWQDSKNLRETARSRAADAGDRPPVADAPTAESPIVTPQLSDSPSRQRFSQSSRTIRLSRRSDRSDAFTAPASSPSPLTTAEPAPTVSEPSPPVPELSSNQGFQTVSPQRQTVTAPPPPSEASAAPRAVSPEAAPDERPSEEASRKSLKASLTALLLPPTPVRPAAAPQQPLTEIVPGLSDQPAAPDADTRPPDPDAPAVAIQRPVETAPIPSPDRVPPVSPADPPVPDREAVSPEIPVTLPEQPESPPAEIEATPLEAVPIEGELPDTPVEGADTDPPPTVSLPETPSASVGEPQRRARAAGPIPVERFEVIGSTVFDAMDLAAIALRAATESDTAAAAETPDNICDTRGPVEFPDDLVLTPSQLVQASSAIEQCYIDQDYISSGAFIAASELTQTDDGTIEITVVEGELEAIEIVELPKAGPFGLNPNYIASRLRAGIGTPFNLAELVETVRLLELDPLINQISTELLPGTQTGTSILNVMVEQDDGFDIDFFVDNDRSPSVGSLRRGVTVSQANILGLGDRLRLGYNFTGGSDEFSLGYAVPINPQNGVIGFDFTSTDSEVIEEPFTILDIQSESRTYELFYRQPIILTPSQELALSLSISRRNSRAEFLEGLNNGDPIPFPGTGADEEGRTRVTAVRFGQEWISRSANQVIALLSEFSFGLDAFDSTIQPIAPDGRFFLWRGQGQWVRSLGEDSVFILRGNIQVADRPVLPNEQFSFGGQSAGRGYRLNTLLRDNGWFLSSEARLPLFRLPRREVLVRVAPFFDVGGGWNRGDFPETQFLTSTGLGLLVDVGDTVSARLDWGLPLSDFDAPGTDLQDSGIHFSIRIGF